MYFEGDEPNHLVINIMTNDFIDNCNKNNHNENEHIIYGAVITAKLFSINEQQINQDNNFKYCIPDLCVINISYVDQYSKTTKQGFSQSNEFKETEVFSQSNNFSPSLTISNKQTFDIPTEIIKETKTENIKETQAENIKDAQTENIKDMLTVNIKDTHTISSTIKIDNEPGTSSNKGGKKSIQMSLIIGIVVGVVVLVIIIVIIIIFVISHKKNNNIDNTEGQEEMNFETSVSETHQMNLIIHYLLT